jgi:NifU-like protein involved in Fe-S cluster formation
MARKWCHEQMALELLEFSLTVNVSLLSCMSRFPDTLMERFQSPTNRGGMQCADVTGQGSLNGYPPFVTLYFRIEGTLVAAATFEAEGCGVTIACSSMLTELLIGRSRAECDQITAEQLSQALDGIPTGKEYCAAVAISALRDAVRSWKQSSSAEVE